MNPNLKSALRRLYLLYRAACRDANSSGTHEPRARKCLVYMSQRAVFAASNRSKSLTGALISVQTYDRLIRCERAALAWLSSTLLVAWLFGFILINKHASTLVASVMLIGLGITWYRVRNDLFEVLNVKYLADFMEDLEQAKALLQPHENISELEWLRMPQKGLSLKAFALVQDEIDEGQHEVAKQHLDLFTRLGLVSGDALGTLKAALKKTRAAVV